MTLTFEVERPLSINRCYAHGSGRRLYMTQDGRAFKNRILNAAIVAKVEQGDWPQDLWRITRVEVSYVLLGYRGDTDGPRKVLRDALEGLLYVNDRIVQDGPTPLPEQAPAPSMIVTVRVLEMRSAAEAMEARTAWEKARDARLRRKARKARVA